MAKLKSKMPTVDREQLEALRTDLTIWRRKDIQEFLGLSPANRTGIGRLWNGAYNYLYAGTTEWPPSSQFTMQLPTAGPDVPRLSQWPAHSGVLPPPDIHAPGTEERWYAGTVYAWALKTGRMRTDGTLLPIRGPRGGRRQARQGRPQPLDASYLRLVREMRASDEVWTIQHVAKFLGLGPRAVEDLLRQLRNYLKRGMCSWPPAAAERSFQGRPGKTSLASWPAASGVLPPPLQVTKEAWVDAAGGPASLPPQYLWRAGDVAAWALKTGRVGPDGSPVRAALRRA